MVQSTIFERKEAATLAALLSESVNDSKAIDLGYLTEVCNDEGARHLH